jgi:putative tryptophan/tyrosine transport system substrate-binding protein
MSGKYAWLRYVVIALCGIVVVWPLLALAQPNVHVRHIAVIMNSSADEPDAPVRVATLRRALQDLGWNEGNNLRIDFRWGSGELKLYRQYAAELVALAPDIIVATAGPIVKALQQETRTIPVVFTTTIDPVALGYVASAARPGGNVTGVSYIAQGFSEKYLELLKQIAPTVTRVGVLRDLTVTAGNVQYETVQEGAARLGLTLTSIDVRNAEERKRTVATLSREGKAGLVVTAGVFGNVHRNEIIALAAEYRVPAVYSNRFYVTNGGLLSYGPAFLEQYQRAAGYIDRILKGAKPADLPVQAPTNYETVLNMKTAKALGLAVPRIVLARVNEVVE